MLSPRTKTSGCKLGAEPDRRCSPGAYYSGLTKAVLCSSSFHTSSIRDVPDSEKHQVEVEYGMAPGSYGSTLEIDHIVSLELGGSNDAANLFPEKATLPGRAPGYHVKDKLENVAHAWVCQGKISLRAAQQKIATNWEAFYRLVFGTAPVG
ncbi:MAG: HNH endonuclease signature motif containing protein [Gaiellaceae bacterium]